MTLDELMKVIEDDQNIAVHAPQTEISGIDSRWFNPFREKLPKEWMEYKVLNIYSIRGGDICVYVEEVEQC